MIRKTSFLLCVMLGMFVSCEQFNDPTTSYTYQVPVSENEFDVSSLTDEGIDEALITEMMNKILHEEYKRIDGVLILRNNKLVCENYYHGHSEDILHNMFSASKSITSILTGIAIDKGFVADVNSCIVELLPEYSSYENPDPRKSAITIAHLLNMCSGLECDDWYQHTEESMQKSKDWVKFTLDLPMAFDPGTHGSYCTGGAVVLGRIIENQSGLSLEEFANNYLFKPLGIEEYKWHTMPDGRPSGGGLFFLRPRDMVKIGLLMLNEGLWEGEQIVSKQWIQLSSQSQIKLPGPFDGYGYLWWKQGFEIDTEAFFASGNGGQDIFIIPSKKLVIVFTTGNKNSSLGLQNVEMIWNYILPALKW